MYSYRWKGIYSSTYFFPKLKINTRGGMKTVFAFDEYYSDGKRYNINDERLKYRKYIVINNRSCFDYLIICESLSNPHPDRLDFNKYKPTIYIESEEDEFSWYLYKLSNPIHQKNRELTEYYDLVTFYYNIVQSRDYYGYHILSQNNLYNLLDGHVLLFNSNVIRNPFNNIIHSAVLNNDTSYDIFDIGSNMDLNIKYAKKYLECIGWNSRPNGLINKRSDFICYLNGITDNLLEYEFIKIYSNIIQKYSFDLTIEDLYRNIINLINYDTLVAISKDYFNFPILENSIFNLEFSHVDSKITYKNYFKHIDNKFSQKDWDRFADNAYFRIFGS